MKRLVLALFVAALGCGPGVTPAWKTGDLTPRERTQAKVIAGVGVFNSQWEWESSPWYRSGDGLLAPIYIAVAQDSYMACVIPAADWAILQAGETYPCLSSWIFYRRTR